MKRCIAICALMVTMALLGTRAEGKRIKVMDLKLGHSEDNRIEGPVYDTTGLPALAIEPLAAAYDRNAEVVRSLGFGTKAWELDPSIDLAHHLSTELASAARDLGFVVTPAATQMWTVSGKLTDVFIESKTGFWGAIQSYGYIEVELEVRKPDGETLPHRFRAHEYLVNVNAGLSQRDEAMESVARLLVEAAPDIIADLNRHYFAAPPHPSIQEKLESLTSQELTDEARSRLRAIGFSGDRKASGVLLALLEKTKEEDDRRDLISALANLGSGEIVAPLRQRLPSEEEVCRFMIIKAMDYVGSPEARGVIVDLGIHDEGEANRRRAELIRDRSSDKRQK